MEIEAKFTVPDVETLRRLEAMNELAGFGLTPGKVKQVHDTFLDTVDRRIITSGHVCRRRLVDGQILITLKWSGSVEGAIHRREELEINLPADLPLAQWPPSEIRDRLLPIVGDAPLQSLFDQQQRRVVRMVTQGDRMSVAELSLDEVEVVIEDQRRHYFEIEVEIKADGTEAELAVIEAYLRDEWGLKPEPRSKFRRGFELLLSTKDTTPPQ